MRLSSTSEASFSDENEDDSTENDENNQSKEVEIPHSRGKIVREAMRDILISAILLLLTTLVTYGDFQSSGTSSLLASGMTLNNSMLRIFRELSVFLATSVGPEDKYSGIVWLKGHNCDR